MGGGGGGEHRLPEEAIAGSELGQSCMYSLGSNKVPMMPALQS